MTSLWDTSVGIHAKEFEDSEKKLRGKIPGIKIPWDLLTALADCGDAFERMRYIYEDPPNAKFYIINLPPILHDLILEIMPTWNAKGRNIPPTSRTR